MDGLIVTILLASVIVVFVLFAYWTFSKVFSAAEVRSTSLNELEERIMKLEERLEKLENK